MFAGHYGVAFGVKRTAPSAPLWMLFLAVQLLDVAWAPFVLLGIEGLRIVPGITASNPFDLYYMPYSHSLVAAIAWSFGAAALYRFAARGSRSASVWLGVAVFSHWVLDFLVHRPDLPLYDNTAKVGLGLWNLPALAFGLEAAFLFLGIWLCIGSGAVRASGALGVGVVLLAVHAFVFFGSPPDSPQAAAGMALLAYVVFAILARFLERPPARTAHGT